MRTRINKKASLGTALRRALSAGLATVLLAVGLASCDFLPGDESTTPALTSSTPTTQPTVTGGINVEQYKTPEIPDDAGTYAYVAEVASPSVVSIATEAIVYNQYYGNSVESGAGSGVILGESVDGEYTYIITNNHVVEGYSTITVYMNGDDTAHPAEVCGTDWQTDIAVIRIEGGGFTAATIGNSAELRLGQEVAAIGNPLGLLGGTVTDGIIGCLARTITVEGVSMTLIQHSAGVSPGNSGGGLFNLYGQLIGIVNAKSSGNGVEAIGYAIPIDLALDRAVQIIEQGYVSGTPYLGLTYSQETSSGIVIAEYEYNDELTATGQDPLQAGDILAAVNDVAITEVADLRKVLSTAEVGDTLSAIVLRRVRVSSGFFQQYSYVEVEVNLKVHEYTPAGVSAPAEPSAPEDTGDMEFS